MKLSKKHLLGLFHINRNLGRRIGMSTLLGKQIFWSFSSIYVFFSDIYGFLNYDLRNWSVFIANIVFYLIFTCLNLIFCKQVWKLFVSIWGTLSIWTDDVNEMDKGNFTSALFLDLRKAFDIVNHQILLSKLRLYQCDDHSIKWLNSYLSGRCQKVEIGNEESEF